MSGSNELNQSDELAINKESLPDSEQVSSESIKNDLSELYNQYKKFIVDYSNSYQLNNPDKTLGSLMLGLNEESEEMSKEISLLLVFLFELDKKIQVFDGSIKGFFRGDRGEISHLFINQLNVGELIDKNVRLSKEDLTEIDLHIRSELQTKFNSLRIKMVEEMGDIFCYFCLVSLFFNISLDEIIETNYQKLEERWRNNQQLKTNR